MDKVVVIRDKGILSHEKKGILPFATIWVALEGIMLREISWTEKVKYCLVSCMWNQKKLKS